MNYAVESVDFYTLAALYLDDYEDWGARRRPPRPPEDLRRYQAETTEKAGCLSGLIRSARMPVSPEEFKRAPFCGLFSAAKRPRNINPAGSLTGAPASAFGSCRSRLSCCSLLS